MPRKKAEPEVLQEETVQPEIAQVEETVTAEQPVLEPQVEEPANHRTCTTLWRGRCARSGRKI